MIQNNTGGENQDANWIWIKKCVMDFCCVFHQILSFIGIFSCLLIILVPTFGQLRAQELPDNGRKQRQISKPKCVATALRLNLDLTRLYGKWYPTEASDTAYLLWMTSLYGKSDKGPYVDLTQPSCIVLKFEAGPEPQTLNIELGHKNKSVSVQAALLADEVHPGTSKWVISWPNGEDTLTSIVATGSVNSENQYDWMLTVDCDLKGSVSPDWAIFSREGGLSPAAINAIKSILNGIEDLKQNQGRQLDTAQCQPPKMS